MAHFGIMTPEIGGHLPPVMSLARELQRRGHRITFYQLPISRARLKRAGFGCRTYGEAEFPPEVSSEFARKLAQKSGLRAFSFTIEMISRLARACLAEVPELMRADGVDVLLMDEALQMGSTVAQAAGVPHAVLSIALFLDGDLAVPPFCTSWRYRASWWAVLRNRVAYKVLRWLARPVERVVIEYRQQIGLQGAPPQPFLHLCQQPAEFEYLRRVRPVPVHFVGPLTDPGVREPVDFPFEKLDGRPLVYASLGSVLGSKKGVFRCIAKACASLDVQLVISLGGNGNAAEMSNLPGSPLVVQFAPQLELLKRTALCITHAGMNTTLECLAEGVPMVALPLMNDAPGVAARIKWFGCGEMLSGVRVNASRLRGKIRRVLDDRGYKDAASRMRDAIARAGGVNRAADLIELNLPVPPACCAKPISALGTSMPVLV